MKSELILIIASLFMFVFYVYIALRYTRLLTENERLKQENKVNAEKYPEKDIFLALGFIPETPAEILENTRIIGEYFKKAPISESVKLSSFAEEKLTKNKEKLDKIYNAIEN